MGVDQVRVTHVPIHKRARFNIRQKRQWRPIESDAFTSRDGGYLPHDGFQQPSVKRSTANRPNDDDGLPRRRYQYSSFLITSGATYMMAKDIKTVSATAIDVYRPSQKPTSPLGLNLPSPHQVIQTSTLVSDIPTGYSGKQQTYILA